LVKQKSGSGVQPEKLVCVDLNKLEGKRTKTEKLTQKGVYLDGELALGNY